MWSKSECKEHHKNNFIIGEKSLPGNLYDGHTLTEALDQVERLTGKQPKDCFVDLGYRGHGEEKTTVYVAREKKSKSNRTLRKAMKRRSAIEPIIGHTKSEGDLRRNYLKGRKGDGFNAMMSTIGFNLRQILRKLRFFWLFILWCLCGAMPSFATEI